MITPFSTTSNAWGSNPGLIVPGSQLAPAMPASARTDVRRDAGYMVVRVKLSLPPACNLYWP